MTDYILASFENSAVVTDKLNYMRMDLRKETKGAA